MDWDWKAEPTYESERIRIDGALSPVIFYDMKRPRQAEDDEIARMLSLADYHLQRGLPLVALVRHTRGTGVIKARHRKAFSDWIDERHDALRSNSFSVVVVVPEPIVRAVLRVVYRFRTPPLRTITTPGVPSAGQAVREELARIGHPVTPEIDAFLSGLAD